jgi:hypothetical protein
MNAKCFSLRKAAVALLVPFFLQWNPLPISASHRDRPLPFSQSLLLDLSRPQTLAYSGGMLGEAPIFTDFDGDKKQDIVVARLSENRYQIVVRLSTRSEVTILTPSVQLAGFTVHACDINHDSYQDVVVTSPDAPHPLAVWLGDGKGTFKIADPNLFQNDFRLAESSRYQSGRFPPDQDLLMESSHPVFEKTALAFGDPGLERHPFVGCSASLRASRIRYSSITPRSPPINVLL